MMVSICLYICSDGMAFHIVESKKNVAPRKGQGRKSKATAAKVALMKIKMKAVGDKSTPDSEKVYLHVLLPLGSKDNTKPMFFSKVKCFHTF